jgi:cbb3-type cytochrome oxidase subunit 3
MAAPAEAQRERAVAILKRAYAEGRIGRADFDRRVHRALATRSSWELPLLLRGLLVEDTRLRARVRLRIFAIKALWTLATVVLAYATLSEAMSGISLWLLAFPLIWLGFSAGFYRALRRARRDQAALGP